MRQVQVDTLYWASGEKAAYIASQSPPDGPDILTIKGCIVDTVTKVGEAWLPTVDDWQEWTNSNTRRASYFASITAYCA
jgi:hypothetical protein